MSKETSFPMVRKKLVIHAGLPKTGTSALQELLLSHSERLLEEGIWYPDWFPSPTETFHRFFINELRHEPALVQTEKLLAQADQSNVQTLLLSIEGVTLHADHLDPVAGERFAVLSTDWDVEIFVVLRSTEKWLVSLYRQCVIHPPIRNRPSHIEMLYATGLTYGDFATRDHVRALCDREKIAARFAKIFPEADVQFLEYGPDFISNFTDRAGLSELVDASAAPRANTTLPEPYLEVIRQVNAKSSSWSVHRLVRAVISRATGGGNVHMALYEAKLTGGLRQRVAAVMLWGMLSIMRFQSNPPLKVNAAEFDQARRIIRTQVAAMIFSRSR